MKKKNNEFIIDDENSFKIIGIKYDKSQKIKISIDINSNIYLTTFDDSDSNSQNNIIYYKEKEEEKGVYKFYVPDSSNIMQIPENNNL